MARRGGAKRPRRALHALEPGLLRDLDRHVGAELRRAREQLSLELRLEMHDGWCEALVRLGPWEEHPTAAEPHVRDGIGVRPVLALLDGDVDRRDELRGEQVAAIERALREATR